MKNPSFLLIGLIIVHALIAHSLELTEEEKKKLKPQASHIDQCKEGYPYLGIGDFNLTDSNFSSTVKSSKALLVVVTAKWCDYCCKFEEVFEEIQQNVLNNKTLLHGLDVKMARATVEDVPRLEELVDKLPEFIFYYKGEPHVFQHSFEYMILGPILSKIIRPFKTLDTYEEFENFMNNDIVIEKVDTSFKALRIVGLYSKEDDLREEMKGFKRLAEDYAIFQDLQFALLTKESIISQIRREKGTYYFPDYMRSTVLLIDRKHKIHKLDPTLDHEKLSEEIHSKGKGLVEPLTYETQELFRRTKQPLLVSFVDPTSSSFNPFISLLEEVAKKFEGRVSFAYLDNNKSPTKRQLLGIYHDKYDHLCGIPALGFNTPTDSNLYPFPEDREITVNTLTKFIIDYMEHRLVPFDPKSIQDKGEDRPKHPLYKLLSNAVEVKYKNLHDLVMTEGTDVALLIIDPSDDPNLEQFCKNYDRVAERFKALGIKSVRIAYYDLQLNPPPPSIQVFTTPMLAFIPAYHKSPPFKIYTDTPKETFLKIFQALTMMLYIEKYADIKFKLPDLPHLPPELHEEYYKQKKQIEDEKELKSQGKEENEIIGKNTETPKKLIVDEL